MGHFSSLAESTSPASNEIHSILSAHPGGEYLRLAKMYDTLYARFRETTDNLSEARIRTVFHCLNVLDEIAASMGIQDTPTVTASSIPERLFFDAFSNPRYKAYSQSVTYESRMRQKQRMKQKLLNDRAAEEFSSPISSKSKPDSKEVDYNNVMFNFVANKRKD